jgi:serine/threonine protein kinase
MEVKGIPPDSMIDKSRKREHYFDTDYSPFLIEDEDYGILRIPEDRKLRLAVPSGDRLFIDFLGRCLELDPETRMSAEQALQHPWITQDEATCAVFLQTIQAAIDAEHESSSASAPDFGGNTADAKEPNLLQLAMFR